MKKLLSVLLCAAMLLSMGAMLSACGDNTVTLNVYNWGEQ